MRAGRAGILPDPGATQRSQLLRPLPIPVDCHAVPSAKNNSVPVIAFLVVGILALLSPLLFIRIPSGNEWVRALLDASHGPIFAIVAMLVAALLSGRRGSARTGAWPTGRCT